MNKICAETLINFCSECDKNFSHGEKVYYTWYENRFFCDNCKDIMEDRVSEANLDWQVRKVRKIS